MSFAFLVMTIFAAQDKQEMPVLKRPEIVNHGLFIPCPGPAMHGTNGVGFLETELRQTVVAEGGTLVYELLHRRQKLAIKVHGDGSIDIISHTVLDPDVVDLSKLKLPGRIVNIDVATERSFMSSDQLEREDPEMFGLFKAFHKD